MQSKKLDSRFYQCFVTANVIDLKKLYVYDKKFNLIAKSNEGDISINSEETLCKNNQVNAKSRKKLDKLKTLHGLCNEGDNVYFSSIMSIGGLRLKGYIQVITSPTTIFTSTTDALKFPLLVLTANKKTFYKSESWSNDKQNSGSLLIAKQTLHTSENDTALSVYAARDLKKLYARLDTVSITIIISACIFTFLAGLITMLYLRKTTVTPIYLLQEKLRHAHNDLENRIIERTKDLEHARYVAEKAN